MLKRSIALAVSSTSFAVYLVSPVFAASQNFASTSIGTNANISAMTRSIPIKFLEQQPQLIARPNCDSEDPPPICTGERPPRPTPAPAPAPAPSQNYSAIALYLVNNQSLIQQVINTTWNEAGKGILAQQIKDQINGRRFSKGVNGKEANVNLGTIAPNPVVTLGSEPNQINVRIVIPGNDVTFKVTTNTIFGGYADPGFRLNFDSTVNLKIAVGQNNFLEVVDMNVENSNARIHGINAVGTLVETFGDFFTGGGFSRNITSRVNQNYDVKLNLAQVIKSAINRVLPPGM